MIIAVVSFFILAPLFLKRRPQSYIKANSFFLERIICKKSTKKAEIYSKEKNNRIINYFNNLF